MQSKDLFKLINEHISEFDFLGLSDINKQQAHYDIINSKDFQTSFIIDIINDFDNNEKFKNVSATFVNGDIDITNNIENIELEIELTYHYNNKNYNIIIFIDGEKENGEINFNDFNIKIFSKAGEQIKFEWIFSNQNLYNYLIKSLISPFI